MVARIFALALALVAIVPPVAAQRASGEAEREYRRGYQALEAGDCATALVHYRRSFELSPRPRTRFNIAVCEEELGSGADAWRSYHAFLELAEERDAAIVAKARARIAALRETLRGRIRIESSPPGAVVHVDGEGEARGRTPLTVALAPGPHTIRVALPDLVPVERTVEVVPDRTGTVAVALELPSTITVVADPEDATIEPEGGGAPAIGRYEAPAPPGRRGFAVRRAGYLPERIEVDVIAGRSHVAQVRLRPLPSRATLVVTAIAGARLRIDDGVPTATARSGRIELRSIEPGSHELVVELPGRAPWRDRIHLAPGERVAVALDVPRRSPRRRALGWGLGGVGAASVTAGGVVGVLALRDVAGSPADRDRGERRAWIADGLVVVGAVAAIAAWRLLQGRAPTATISRSAGAR